MRALLFFFGFCAASLVLYQHVDTLSMVLAFAVAAHFLKEDENKSEENRF